MNIGQITKMAQQLQTQMAQAQEELKHTTLEATAGGGAVRIVITGAQEIRSVEIDQAAVDPAEVEMLQDLVMTAINEAITEARSSSGSAWPESPAAWGCRACPGLPGLG